jgi:hypothetical protein
MSQWLLCQSNECSHSGHGNGVDCCNFLREREHPCHQFLSFEFLFLALNHLLYSTICTHLCCPWRQLALEAVSHHCCFAVSNWRVASQRVFWQVTCCPTYLLQQFGHIKVFWSQNRTGTMRLMGPCFPLQPRRTNSRFPW